MSAPHGYCRACRKEVRAHPVERGGDRYWICGECSDVLRDVSWEPDVMTRKRDGGRF